MLSVGLQLALSGAAALAVMMFVIWLVSVRLQNAGIVDVGWSLGLVILSVWYAWQGPGFAPRRWIMAGMVTFWGLRLALHLVRRIASEPEDGRYQQIRRDWAGKNINLRFLFFFEFQALLDVVLSLPMLVAALNPAPELSLLEYAGVALWLVSSDRRECRRCSTGVVQAQSGQSRARMPSGNVAVFAASQLLLRMVHLGGLDDLRLGVAVGMAVRGLSRLDAVLPVPGHRYSGDRGSGAALARG